jgi:hypothetical protein
MSLAFPCIRRPLYVYFNYEQHHYISDSVLDLCNTTYCMYKAYNAKYSVFMCIVCNVIWNMPVYSKVHNMRRNVLTSMSCNRMWNVIFTTGVYNFVIRVILHPIGKCYIPCHKYGTDI